MKDFQIQAIGLMSGTSLDGLDVCCCTFRQQAGKWSFHIDCAKGYSYPDAMKQILGTGAQTMSALEFITFHSSYGKFLGERVNEFMQEFGVHPDIIASHGHTIFHEPQKRIMYQIGDGAAIAAETRIPTVSVSGGWTSCWVGRALHSYLLATGCFCRLRLLFEYRRFLQHLIRAGRAAHRF